MSDVLEVSLLALLAMAAIEKGLPIEFYDTDAALLTEEEQLTLSRAAVRAGYESTRDPDTGFIRIARPGT